MRPRGALAALDRIEQGVVLVDAGAAVVHANRAAEAALGRGDGLTASRSVLACDRADDTAMLRRLVGEASAAPAGRPGGPLAVGAAPAGGRCRCWWRRCAASGVRSAGPPATAIVLMADPEAAVPAAGDAAPELYGLTAAEARTAEALLGPRAPR